MCVCVLVVDGACAMCPAPVSFKVLQLEESRGREARGRARSLPTVAAPACQVTVGADDSDASAVSDR